MPHISKKKIDQKIAKRLEKNVADLFRNTGSKTRVAIIDELLTKTEQVMLAKRIGILLLLRKGFSHYKIGMFLGVSTSTVKRFERAVQAGRYRHTVNWAWRHTKDGSLETLLESLVALVFTGRTRSFKKIIDEL